jgi:hypothetical protein
MTPTAPLNNTRQAPRSGNPGDVTARASPKMRRRQSPGYVVAVVGAFLLLAALGVLCAKTARSVLPSQADEPSDLRTGHITDESVDRRDCQERIFDNQTGRVTRLDKRCGDAVVLDSRGMPIPLGTLHRMDAIKKSFAGQ